MKIDPIIISIAGVIISLVLTIFVSGVRWGAMQIRVTNLEKSQLDLATKEQMENLKSDVAEIKGMFRMTLKSDGMN